ncbi:hypothetical protein B0H14DRAFT_2599901 [Mycena olivaceomarginata]|nr:hypothetical protein B0H14DRAFT_2599901 [Mycena olivaceomarginata]
MIEALRNNMDIKFIGSGASAKGILYYITDYITKSQLKTHVAFSMLELAVKKLGEFNPHEDDTTTRAKKLLQKCAYAMLSQQELSAQQVASYLLDFEDHFTSHTYRNLYWTSFENFINREDPSPECYTSKRSVSSTSDENNPDSDRAVEPNAAPDTDSDSEDEDEDESESPFLNDLVNPEGLDETADATDEIRVSFDGTGNLVPMGSQLADYQMHGHELDNICVWDFTSRVDRVAKSSDSRRHRSTSPDTNMETSPDFLDNVADDEPENPQIDGPSMMASEERHRPRAALLHGHDQASTHILRIRKPDDTLVPVPIGPAIPRRDKAEIRGVMQVTYGYKVNLGKRPSMPSELIVRHLS